MILLLTNIGFYFFIELLEIRGKILEWYGKCIRRLLVDSLVLRKGILKM